MGGCSLYRQAYDIENHLPMGCHYCYGRILRLCDVREEANSISERLIFFGVGDVEKLDDGTFLSRI